ncbi:hypothetical protein DAI22_06g172703 [Oryza sativa Japonica Group]|nr:hypothetical protein DAI22_06g172703 [Oryza sativa Japonica Group]
MNGCTGGAGGVAAGRLPAVSLQQAQWKLVDERCELREEEMEYVRWFHRYELVATGATPSLPNTSGCPSKLTTHPP